MMEIFLRLIYLVFLGGVECSELDIEIVLLKAY